MKIIKITRWGISKLQCIKAVKDLMGLTIRDAKDLIENSEMPCILEVHDSEKLKTFTSYTQGSCSGMKYTVEDCNEDSDHDVDIDKYKEMSITDLVEGFASAMNNAHAMFNVLIIKNNEIGDRYNKVCAEANMLQAEVEKLKANNNNDLCIQLREEIARLKRDNELLQRDNEILRKGKKVVETKNDDLVAANKSLEEVVQNSNEILKAIKNLVS